MLAELGSGIVSLVGGQRANEANLQNSRESDARSRVEAKEQRDFQERMSNTQHQRQVQDLIKAGLNPLLSATGGASSPAGAMGSTSTAQAQDILTPTLSSALQAKRLGQEMEMQNKNIESVDQDIRLKKAQTAETGMRTTVMSKDIPKADITNKVYNYFNKLIDSMQTSPKNTYKNSIPGMPSLKEKIFLKNK